MPISGIINSQITILVTTTPSVRTTLDSNTTSTWVNVIPKNLDTTNATLFTGARTSSIDFQTPETAGTNVPFNQEATRQYTGTVGQTLHIRARAQATGKDLSLVSLPTPSSVTLLRLRMATPEIFRSTNTTSTQTFQVRNLGPGTGRIFYRLRRQADNAWGSFVDAGTRLEDGTVSFSFSNPWSEEQVLIQAFVTDDSNVRRESVTAESEFFGPTRTAPVPSINATLVEREARKLTIRLNNNYGTTDNLFQSLTTQIRRSIPGTSPVEFTDFVNAGTETTANSEIDFTYTNLEPNSSYTIQSRNIGNNVNDSNNAQRTFSTLALPLTASPSFPVNDISSTAFSISFKIKNEENAQVNIRYALGSNPNSESDNFNLGANLTSNTLTFDELDPGINYVVHADAERTDQTKSRSSVTQQTITTVRRTATPLIGDATNIGINSFTFRADNQDAQAILLGWQVRQGSETGTIIQEVRVDDQDAISIPQQGHTNITVSGLNSNTTYFFRAFAKASDAIESNPTDYKSTITEPIKVWVSGATGTIREVQLNLGFVQSCPTIAQALAELEAAFPAQNQNVGDRGRVNAVDINTFQECIPRDFTVQTQ